MIKSLEKEQIKKLIKNGFDLELISFELDIPKEKLIAYKQELEIEERVAKAKTNNTSNLMIPISEVTSSKMEELRQRYKKLYFGNCEEEKSNQLSEEKIDSINLEINGIQDKIQQMKFSKGKKRSCAYDILRDILSLKDKKMNIDQTEELMKILNCEEFKNIKINEKNKIYYYINNTKKEVLIKLAKAIEEKISEVKEVEKLRALNKKLSSYMLSEYNVLVQSVKLKINNKIEKIEQRDAIYRLRNNIPESIESIVKNLAEGSLNIEEAKLIIEEEAKANVQSRPKTRFAITQEQEMTQLIFKIKNALIQQSMKYKIINPEMTIKRLQELCNVSFADGVRLVVKNAIGRKEFQEAKDLCKSYSDESKEDAMYRTIKSLKKEIRNAEISDFVLQGINMKGTNEQDKVYYEFIIKALKRANVNPNEISLGLSADGLKEIRLSKIMDDEVIIKK